MIFTKNIKISLWLSKLQLANVGIFLRHSVVTCKCVVDVLQAALERGERLGELEERTAQMRSEAEEFSKSAHQLKNKYRDKKWYQFWEQGCRVIFQLNVFMLCHIRWCHLAPYTVTHVCMCPCSWHVAAVISLQIPKCVICAWQWEAFRNTNWFLWDVYSFTRWSLLRVILKVKYGMNTEKSSGRQPFLSEARDIMPVENSSGVMGKSRYRENPFQKTTHCVSVLQQYFAIFATKCSGTTIEDLFWKSSPTCAENSATIDKRIGETETVFP